MSKIYEDLKEVFVAAAAAAKSLQSCPTLCDPTDGSPPGSFCPGDSPGKNIGVGCHFLLSSEKEIYEINSHSLKALFVFKY